MMNLKMTGNFYDDVKKVNEAICYLQTMVEILEKECMQRDKGKVATGLFIRINGIKNEMDKLVSEGERMLREADIDQFGPLYELINLSLFINNLEVKEVDLEKEYDNEFFKDPVFGKLVNRNAGISIAKHFFELGLKAQKGE